MKFKIKPFLIDELGIYGILFDEIMNFSIDEINLIIKDMDNVFLGQYTVSSFSGQHMATVEYNKDTASIRYFDDLIGEESTMDIYNMLKSYQKILIECSNL